MQFRRQADPQEAPQFAGILRLLGQRLMETALAGCARTHVRTLLCPFSLLTGNFTGKFSQILAFATPETPNSGGRTVPRSKFPAHKTGNLFGATGIPDLEAGIFIGNAPIEDYIISIKVMARSIYDGADFFRTELIELAS
jgi:hypothetical protein